MNSELISLLIVCALFPYLAEYFSLCSKENLRLLILFIIRKDLYSVNCIYV